MITAVSRCEEESFNIKMQMLAWQTSLLMNSTGNYKKKIKPTDLFSPEERETVEENISEDDKKKLKRQKQEELLKAFADSV